LSKDAINNAFVYAGVGNAKLPLFSILKTNAGSFGDVVDYYVSSHTKDFPDWTFDTRVDYWNVDSISAVKHNDILIQVILRGRPGPNKLGEQPVKDSGLVNLAPIGFTVVHKSGKQIIYEWNSSLKKFDVKFDMTKFDMLTV
jgi:hypothetical protein